MVLGRARETDLIISGGRVRVCATSRRGFKDQDKAILKSVLI